MDIFEKVVALENVSEIVEETKVNPLAELSWALCLEWMSVFLQQKPGSLRKSEILPVMSNGKSGRS